MPCGILIGDNPASEVYVRNKKIACEKVGIKSISMDLKDMQRLREVAINEGWDEVINVRIDTSPMTPASQKKGLKAVEVFAYGTGIKYS